MDGIFLIDKPIGLTSRKVSNMVSFAYKEKKVGHVGTLDPFASGLLIVACGKCTKAVTFFDESVKEYIATIKLGKETDTLDNTGVIIKEDNVREYTIDEIKEVLNSFKGEGEQIPPMTSAIRVNGKRLYELAHKGIEVDRVSRKIHVYDIKLLSYDENSGLLTIYCKVSKGTYIRTLGSDIAKKLGTIGYLEALQRVGVSPFDINESSSLEDVMNKKAKAYSTYEILSRFIKVVTFDETKIEDIKNGKIPYLEINTEENTILVANKSSEAIAIYRRNEHQKLEFVRGLF